MFYFFIPLGYNWIIPGKPSGTEARCDALLQYREKHRLAFEHCRFILTTDRPPGSNHRPMAEEMADYIRQQSADIFCPNPQPMGWGTVAEIKNAIAQIRKIKSINEPVSVFISTNPGHMIRIRLYWWALAPKEWRVIFVPADHSFTKKEWFQETAKVIRDLSRIATGKIKRTTT